MNTGKIERVKVAELERSTQQKFKRTRIEGISRTKIMDNHWWNKLIVDIDESCKKIINLKKSSGKDGVHSFAIKRFYNQTQKNVLLLTEDAITRPTALYQRLTLINKKDGPKRPIQMLNQVKIQTDEVRAQTS